MRTEVWYPLCGLALLAWLTLGLQALTLSFLKKANEWVNWGFGILAGLLSLASGFYATQNTWIEQILIWIVGLHPVVVLIVGLGFIYAVWKLAEQAVPDKWSGATMTIGSILLCFFLPMVAQNALPPGDIPDGIAKGIGAITDFAVKQTAGWFA